MCSAKILISSLRSTSLSVEVSPVPKWTLGYHWTVLGKQLPCWTCSNTVVASLDDPAGGLVDGSLRSSWWSQIWEAEVWAAFQTKLQLPWLEVNKVWLVCKQWTLFLTATEGKSAPTRRPCLGSWPLVLRKGLLGQGTTPQHTRYLARPGPCLCFGCKRRLRAVGVGESRSRGAAAGQWYPPSQLDTSCLL